MVTLDNLNEIKKLDSGKVKEALEETPNQYQMAWQDTDIKIPKNYKDVSQIVVCGMGGSAIGGDLAKNFSKLPLITIRDYNLPDFINDRTLIILVSYSGNTEEVLSCLEHAKRGKVFVITSGGNLLKKAKSLKLPFCKIDYFSSPRLSLPNLFVPLIKILEKLDILREKIDFKETISLLKDLKEEFKAEVEVEKNFAKTLAYNTFDHIPFVISSEEFGAVGRRWKTQFNENSKNFSFSETLPELKHNTIEGISFPGRAQDDLLFLLLESSADKPEIKKFFDKLKLFLEKESLRYKIVFGQGESLLSQKLSLIYLGDWVSFYLAMLNQVNPGPVEKIKWFKKL